jgi:tRNA threonylcarbamoyladenosine biosynthesis protein TsaE
MYEESSVYGVDEIDEIIKRLIMPYVQTVSVILFFGTLGSGKTTMIKRLVALLGSEQMVTSPTFNYVNIYQGTNIIIQHFDLYRLSDASEVEELGLHEQIGAPGTLSLIEWPSIIEQMVVGAKNRHGIMRIYLSYLFDNHAVRQIKVQIV